MFPMRRPVFPGNVCRNGRKQMKDTSIDIYFYPE
jgi:hypothetical protein